MIFENSFLSWFFDNQLINKTSSLYQWSNPLHFELFPQISNPDIEQLPAVPYQDKQIDYQFYRSLEWCHDLLQQIGSFARENHIRLTFHPGQFNILGTNDSR